MKKIIEIKNLSYSYTDLKVLQNLNFSVEANEFLAIIGPLGSGKTTLLKIIAGLKKADKGNILFQGKNLLKPTRKIGFIFQKNNLLPWLTVWENIILPLKIQQLSIKEIEKRGEEIIELVDLKKFKHMYPHELSGGMEQLAALTRAFITDAELLLLDEPFASLDVINREKMNLELLKLWKQRKKTILFVTHSIEEAVFLADKIILLASNKIKKELTINFPRPRNINISKSKKFLNKKCQIKNLWQN